MIVRNEEAALLLVGQTDHSRLVGQFGAHWGNERFARPEPYDSVARAAAFHDFGWLRYETAPLFDLDSGGTPSFREIPNDENKLEEYAWCIDWLLQKDPYAGHIVDMHRTGLWRGRYDAMAHPPHGIRKQPAAVDAYIAEREERRKRELAANRWDPQQLRVNYRLLQVWDLLGLYFACQAPYDEYLEPVPTSYDERDGEGVRITLTPVGERRVRFDPFPFDMNPCHVQLSYRRLPAAPYADEDAFRRAYFQSALEVMDFELV